MRRFLEIPLSDNPFAASDRTEVATPSGTRPLRAWFVGAGLCLGLAYLISWASHALLVLAYVQGSSAVDLFHGTSETVDPEGELLVGLLGLGFGGFLVLYLMAAPLWAVWHHRAAANARAMGRDSGISPGMHVGWWFVPVAHLWMPQRALRQLWEASHPGNPSYDADPAVHTPAVVAPGSFAVWWALHLAGSIGSRVTDRASEFMPPEVWLGTQLILLAATTAALIFYLRFLRQITDHQDQLMAEAPG